MTFFHKCDIIRKSGIEHEFRTTIVKGIHSEEDLEKIAEMLSGEEKYFLQTFKDSGNLIGNGISAFDAAETEKILKTVQKYIPNTIVRG